MDQTPFELGIVKLLFKSATGVLQRGLNSVELTFSPHFGELLLTVLAFNVRHEGCWVQLIFERFLGVFILITVFPNQAATGYEPLKLGRCD